MPSKPVYTQIDGQSVKLTNLQKTLYPSVGVVKAELIQYYMQVADYILPYLQGRLMTLIRYPDGVEAHKFYSKNKPTWTPEWIASGKTDEADDNVYIILNDKASLVWAANLASLELHHMTVRADKIDRPDFFIFDLDPPASASFEVVKAIALKLKPFLEGYGYKPFVKTSGSKGLHIYVPIAPTASQSEVVEAVKDLAKTFVASNPETTLLLNKSKRGTRVLLDIYRNNKSQTCAAPFSTRGRSGAPVSMPILWEDLPKVTSSKQYNIRSAIEALSTGNPWANFFTSRSRLHTKRDQTVAIDLKAYENKRDFDKTAEPSPVLNYGANDQYVIQLHDASNLHYDLRLEKDGTLLSWAIPKGMPVDKGVKRLAIQTEPHPVKYLDFEGVIPANEYGGGTMWIFERGTYQMESHKSKSIKFSLDNGTYAGSYKMYNTKDKQWIIEKLTDLNLIASQDVRPMLASSTSKLPSSSKYFFEIKWDGIRVTVTKSGKSCKIISRSGKDLTHAFPLIENAILESEPENMVIDGEIVVLDKDAKPVFSKVISRMHTKGSAAIERAAKVNPACLYAFDMMYLDGKDIRSKPIETRRDWLKINLDLGTFLRYSEAFDDGKQLYDGVIHHGLEGIMCKVKGAPYQSGARTTHWIKMKPRIPDTAIVIGYTQGQGDRQGLMGAIHLAKKKNDELVYMGKVGTGFDQAKLKSLTALLKEAQTVPKPIKDQIEEPHRTQWIESIYQADITYTSMTNNDTYREPVFVKMYKITK